MVAKRHANTQRMIDDLQAKGEQDELVHDKKRNTVARADADGLTEKQASFARFVGEGLTLAEAYRKSYDCETMAKSSIYAEASRLMDNPRIAAKVRQLLTDRRERTYANDALRIRQHVIDRLMIESVEDDSRAAERLKALEMLGNLDFVQMFKTSSKAEDATETTDIVALQSKLEGMLKKMIDITPKG